MMGREDKGMKEEMKLEFDAISENEGLARVVIAAFLTRLDPTLEQLQDVKTAVSEAVTNAIIHGYGDCDDVVVNEKEDYSAETNEENREKSADSQQVYMTCQREGKKLTIIVEDKGIGIADIEEARQPFFTTKPDMERSGMGFAFMESFMDEVLVESKLGEGTRVKMTKYIVSTEENVQ